MSQGVSLREAIACCILRQTFQQGCTQAPGDFTVVICTTNPHLMSVLKDFCHREFQVFRTRSGFQRLCLGAEFQGFVGFQHSRDTVNFNLLRPDGAVVSANLESKMVYRHSYLCMYVHKTSSCTSRYTYFMPRSHKHSQPACKTFCNVHSVPFSTCWLNCPCCGTGCEPTQAVAGPDRTNLAVVTVL